MLVLSRQRDETIMIGDDIEITVVDIRGDKVRLGINAPRTVQVHRKEVYDAIKRENTEASLVQVDDLAAASRNLKPLAKSQPLVPEDQVTAALKRRTVQPGNQSSNRQSPA